MRDIRCGTCGPNRLSPEEFEALWQMADAAKAKRAADMPTEQDAINAMHEAYQRLKELDWNDPIYCPKDGSEFDVIEAGSTGIFKGWYEGEWPSGSWWLGDGGDVYPSRPTLYRRTEAEKARWNEAAERLRGLMPASVDRNPEGEKPQALSAQHESAVPEADAQTPPEGPSS